MWRQRGPPSLPHQVFFSAGPRSAARRTVCGGKTPGLFPPAGECLCGPFAGGSVRGCRVQICRRQEWPGPRPSQWGCRATKRRPPVLSPGILLLRTEPGCVPSYELRAPCPVRFRVTVAGQEPVHLFVTRYAAKPSRSFLFFHPAPGIDFPGSNIFQGLIYSMELSGPLAMRGVGFGVSKTVTNISLRPREAKKCGFPHGRFQRKQGEDHTVLPKGLVFK